MKPLLPLLLLSFVLPLQADENTPIPDNRELVLIPHKPLSILRADMVQHLLQIDRIVALLALGNFDGAADYAEQNLGNSSKGKHLATGTPPGRYMSPSMRELAWGMHDSASEFAAIAREGDMAKSLTALGKLTSTCTACHLSYRVR